MTDLASHQAAAGRRLLCACQVYVSLQRHLHPVIDGVPRLVRSAARAFARGEIDDAFELMPVMGARTWFWNGVLPGWDRIPVEVREMEEIARKGTNPADVLGMLGLGHAAAIGDWIRHIRAEDPRAWAKFPRMTFADVWRAQKAWHERLATSKKAVQRKDLASCPVIHRYDDGWSWVQVVTPEQKDAEGSHMGHCVGQGGYDDLGRGRAIFSLRDPRGEPRVTVDMTTTRVMQAKGPGNRKPSDDEMKRVRHLQAGCTWRKLKNGVVRWRHEDVVVRRLAAIEEAARRREEEIERLMRKQAERRERWQAERRARGEPDEHLDIIDWAFRYVSIGDALEGPREHRRRAPDEPVAFLGLDVQTGDPVTTPIVPETRRALAWQFEVETECENDLLRYDLRPVVFRPVDQHRFRPTGRLQAVMTDRVVDVGGYDNVVVEFADDDLAPVFQRYVTRRDDPPSAEVIVYRREVRVPAPAPEPERVPFHRTLTGNPRSPQQARRMAR